MRPAPLVRKNGYGGADRRVCARGADPRPSCAADWRGALEIPSVLERSIVQSVPEAHVVERASRVSVPLMVFPLVDVPKDQLLAVRIL